MKDEFLKNIWEQQEKMGLSTAELSRKSGVSEPLISKYKNKNTIPYLSKALQLAATLGVVHLWLPSELQDRLSELASELGTEQAELIVELLWKATLSKDLIFKTCPTCKVAMFDLEKVAQHGPFTAVCKNGHETKFE